MKEIQMMICHTIHAGAAKAGIVFHIRGAYKHVSNIISLFSRPRKRRLYININKYFKTLPGSQV